jgi:hypothetical protein
MLLKASKQIKNNTTMPELTIENVLLVVTSLVTFASVIVKLTPSQADDTFMAKFVLPVLNFISLAKK